MIPGGRPTPGWRLAVNRALFVGAIALVAPVVVALERLRPGAGRGARLAHRAARRLMRLLGVRIELRGFDRLDRSRGYVLVPNHRSAADVGALLAALPGIRFAAAVEVFRKPLLGAAMRALGTIPVDRRRPEAAKRALDRAARESGRAVWVAIFPEGRIVPSGPLGEFKGGPFVFAIRAQLPVVPVAIHGGAAVMPPARRLEIRPGAIVLEALDEIATQGRSVEDRDELRERARDALLAALRPDDGGTAQRPELAALLERRGAPS